jgi:hypothetical protein
MYAGIAITFLLLWVISNVIIVIYSDLIGSICLIKAVKIIFRILKQKKALKSLSTYNGLAASLNFNKKRRIYFPLYG